MVNIDRLNRERSRVREFNLRTASMKARKENGQSSLRQNIGQESSMRMWQKS